MFNCSSQPLCCPVFVFRDASIIHYPLPPGDASELPESHLTPPFPISRSLCTLTCISLATVEKLRPSGPPLATFKANLAAGSQDERKGKGTGSQGSFLALTYSVLSVLIPVLKEFSKNLCDLSGLHLDVCQIRKISSLEYFSKSVSWIDLILYSLRSCVLCLTPHFGSCLFIDRLQSSYFLCLPQWRMFHQIAGRERQRGKLIIHRGPQKERNYGERLNMGNRNLP